jgi:transposase
MGRRGRNNRLFIDAIVWKLRTGVPWRDLPSCYGHWKSVSNRFYRWRDTGVWARLFARFAEDPDLEWLMIDATHVKVYAHAGQKGEPGYGTHQGRAEHEGACGRQWFWFACAPYRHLRHERRLYTGSCPDRRSGPTGPAADKAYDTDAIITALESQGTSPVIPPKKNRTLQRTYDKALYKLRHMVENSILNLKGWRAIATRYAKTTKTFLAECQIAALFL